MHAGGEQASTDSDNSTSGSNKATAHGMTSSTHVAPARLTSGIRHHEPIDHLGGVVHSHNEALRRLYYFTQIRDLKGRTVTHAWWHDGRLMSKVTLRIGGNRWRTNSAMNITPDMTGAWRVVVTDSRGRTLRTAHFTYATP